MKQSKKTGKESEGQPKVKENTWKSKAISRRIESDKLRKRLTEVLQSRDNWKSKWKSRYESGELIPLMSGEKADKKASKINLINGVWVEVQINEFT